MVSEEGSAALHAEHAARREQVAQALQRIAEWEAKKTPPPPLAFVKANRPARRVTTRRKRAASATRARRREPPTRPVEQAIGHCPDRGSARGGGQVGRVRQGVDLPAPPPVEITAHQVQRAGAAPARSGARRRWSWAGRGWGVGGWAWASPRWSRTCARSCACRSGRSRPI